MRKSEELSNPRSCLNRAKDDEILFVLLGRDKDTPGTIRDWVARRVKKGKNEITDPEILEALATAEYLEEESYMRAISDCEGDI